MAKFYPTKNETTGYWEIVGWEKWDYIEGNVGTIRMVNAGILKVCGLRLMVGGEEQFDYYMNETILSPEWGGGGSCSKAWQVWASYLTGTALYSDKRHKTGFIYYTDEPDCEINDYTQIRITNNYNGTATLTSSKFGNISKTLSTAYPDILGGCISDSLTVTASDPGPYTPTFSLPSAGLSGVLDLGYTDAKKPPFAYAILVGTGPEETCDIDVASNYTDEKWTYKGYVTAGTDILASDVGGRFDVTGGPLGSLKNVWLCSKDCLWDQGPCVILRSREGEFWLTRSERINFGKLPEKEKDMNYYLWLWLQGKWPPEKRVPNPVSNGIIVSATATQAVVDCALGRVSMKNVYGILSIGTRVVILNLVTKNNFIRVLGPAQEL